MHQGKRSGLATVYATALDWLFPPRCAGCKRFGEHWCSDCQTRVGKIEMPFCLRCGFPLEGAQDCPACSHRRFAFDAARSWARYDGELRQAIISLKNRHNENLARQLARALVELFQAQDWKVDLLVPIPLAPQRLAERGYNQVEVLARPFSEATHLAAPANVLQRRRETQTQVGLNPLQRRQNLRGAFAADSGVVRGLSVLLLDDIMTTGATLDAAAWALKKAGAQRVCALTLGRTILKGQLRVW